MIKKSIIITIYEDVEDLELPPTSAESIICEAINTACLNLGYSETEFLPPEIISRKELLSSSNDSEVIIAYTSTSLPIPT